LSAPNLRPREPRFAFGQNWLSFVDTIDEAAISEAERGLNRLFPKGELAGRRFLDIGCGSGLSMLAALRLGAAEAHGIDIDPDSVAAARTLLSRSAPGGPWIVREASVLTLDPGPEGTFEIVYSWGVLHHTGAMREAIRRAAALVAPGGHFALALYRKTPLCRLWQIEKRLYSTAGATPQAMLRALYKGAFAAGLVATGRSPRDYIRRYRSARGMDWAHDVHDWLGGYPYESTTPAEVAALLDGLGFELVRVFEKRAAAAGLFGSHCDEFVARRVR